MSNGRPHIAVTSSRRRWEDCPSALAHLRGHTCLEQRGSAIIEMMIVMPLFLALLSGIIDYSLAINDRVALTEAARLAARTAAHSLTFQSDASIANEARAVVQRVLSSAGYDSALYTTAVNFIDLPLGAGMPAKAVQVTVVAETGLRPLAILPGRLFRSQASSTFRCEFSTLPAPGPT
jgi:Flp pilus assembly protein TadG